MRRLRPWFSTKPSPHSWAGCVAWGQPSREAIVGEVGLASVSSLCGAVKKMRRKRGFRRPQGAHKVAQYNNNSPRATVRPLCRVLWAVQLERRAPAATPRQWNGGCAIWGRVAQPASRWEQAPSGGQLPGGGQRSKVGASAERRAPSAVGHEGARADAGGEGGGGGVTLIGRISWTPELHENVRYSQCCAAPLDLVAVRCTPCAA